MARYYIKFETMKGLLSLEPRSKMSDIVRILEAFVIYQLTISAVRPRRSTRIP